MESNFYFLPRLNILTKDIDKLYFIKIGLNSYELTIILEIIKGF